MNTKAITDLVKLAAELPTRESLIERREAELFQVTLEALKHWKRDQARQLFEVSLAWNQIHEFLAGWKTSLTAKGGLIYVVDAWFLQDLIQRLTPRQDEEIAYVTGINLEGVKILSRICGVALEQQSVVYARATSRSCADTLADILDHGMQLLAMGHSHPGSGAAATHESSIDVNYLGRIQRAGADVIGLIVTRDGFVRFFTVEKPFQVLVLGNGVNQVEEYVFQIALPKKDCHQKVDAT
jgi:hypothetical protein